MPPSISNVFFVFSFWGYQCNQSSSLCAFSSWPYPQTAWVNACKRAEWICVVLGCANASTSLASEILYADIEKWQASITIILIVESDGPGKSFTAKSWLGFRLLRL